ncbi:unnamed protein product, partial [Mesorhabditis belari]|uniref:E3 ubiquitin-protein ligase n=1 Tax=Mesorhabditis belari TaxID=2138241 RepID=A0AAF3F490_9BILA
MKRKLADGQSDGPPTKADITAGKEPVASKRESSGKKTLVTPSIVDEQELLRSLHNAVLLTSKDVCEEIRNKSMMPIEFDPQVVERATAVLFDTFTQAWVPDLFAFSEHAKRATIGVEDMKLLLRRNPKLCQSIETSCGVNLEASKRNAGRPSKRKSQNEPKQTEAADFGRDDTLFPMATTPDPKPVKDFIGLTPKPPIAQSTPIQATPRGGRNLPARRLPSPIVECEEANSEDKLLAWERELAMKTIEKENFGHQSDNRCEMYDTLFNGEPSTSAYRQRPEIVKDETAFQTNRTAIAEETMMGEETILGNLGFDPSQDLDSDSFNSFDGPQFSTPIREPASSKPARDSFDDELELIDDMSGNFSKGTPVSKINPFKKGNEPSTSSAVKGSKTMESKSTSKTSNKISPPLQKSKAIEYDSFDEDFEIISSAKPISHSNAWEVLKKPTGKMFDSAVTGKGRAYDSFFDDDITDPGVQESHSSATKAHSSSSRSSVGKSDASNSTKNPPLATVQPKSSEKRLDVSTKSAQSKLGENPFSEYYMPPGDSRTLGFTSNEPCDVDDSIGGAGENATNVFLKLDELTKEETIFTAVHHWKSVADRLKKAGYPLFVSERDERFNHELHDKAQELFTFLDQLLGDTKDGILETDAIYQKLWFLMAQGQPLESFKQTMFEMDCSEKCSAIWENEAVAYRCNTCALTPCMSLCASCFNAGNHEGHDFTRFFSREGGACDCGNKDVLKEEGFCKRHRSNTEKPLEISPLVVSLPEYTILRIVIRLFAICRGFAEKTRLRMEAMKDALEANEWLRLMSLHGESIVRQTTKIVAFLQDCVNIGGPLRDAISVMLLDKELYKQLNRPGKTKIVTTLLDLGNCRELEEDKLSLSKSVPEEYGNGDEEMLKTENLLDELIFWIVRLTFPQTLINFSLSMLSSDSYRDHFAYRFFKLYPCTVTLIKEIAAINDQLSDYYTVHTIACRVIHISVQMLSSEALCLRLDDSVNVIRVVLSAVNFLFKEATVENRMTLAPLFRNVTDESAIAIVTNSWRVINCERNTLLATHGYWFVMGDLHNLLSHYAVAARMVAYQQVFRDYFVQHICIMQGMHQCFRIVTGDHREIEHAEVYQREFTLEYETSATSMFSLILGIAHLSYATHAIEFINAFKAALEKWFVELNYPRTTILSCHPFSVSFHIPLHRNLSTALTHFKNIPGMFSLLESFRADANFLKKLILHPMRIQVVRAEHQNGMWVRNGAQLRVHAFIYAQPHISTALLMPDIDLIRFCVANLDPDWVWECVLESFHMQDIFEWTTRQRKKIVRRTDGEEPKPATSQESPRQAAQESSITSGGQAIVKNPVPLQSPQQGPVESKAQIENIINDLKKGETSAISEKAKTEEEMKAEVTPENTKRISDILWRGFYESEVITRPEWIDTMVAGALRLIAQCVVIPGSWERSINEIVRNEIVLVLSDGDYTFSKLRSAAIPDKGSRGIENIDEIFEQELKKVADYLAPDASRQGRFRLKESAWRDHFCPLFTQVRGHSAKHWNAIINRVEEREKAQLPGVDSKKSQLKLWIPYRLIDFEKTMSDQWTSGVCNLLTCERFFEMSAIILKACCAKTYLQDQSEQLVIYLLSLSVKYVGSLPEDKRGKILRYLHMDWNFRKKDGSTGSLSVITVLSAMFADALATDDFAARIKEEIGKDVQNRITGTKIDYMARLFNLLYKTDRLAKNLLDSVILTKTSFKIANDVTEKDKEEKRLLAKRRREQLLELTKKKNEETMKAMMEKEGITQEEMDDIDTSQPSVRLYDCPICGDTTPSTTNQPLGMLVQMEENDIVGSQVDANEETMTLLEADAQYAQNGLLAERLTLRTWESARGELVNTVKPYDGLVEASSSMEIKTCGHCAHITCLTQYANTLQRLEVNRSLFTTELSCPLCRGKFNYCLPLAFDFGFEMSTRHKEHTMVEARKRLLEAIVERKPDFTDPIEKSAFISHYKESIDGLLSHMQSHKEYTIQNHIAGLIKANVERNLLQAKIFLDGKRRKNRMLVVEHLVAALVARTSNLDVKTMLCAARDLFEPTFFGDQSVDPPSSSSDSTFNFIDEIDEDQPMIAFDTEENQRALLDVLRPSLNRPRGPYDSIKKKSDVPLLLFDHRSLLVKLTAYLVQQRFACEEKLNLCRLVAQLCHDAALTRCCLQLLIRLTFDDAMRIGKSNEDSLLSLAAREFLECRPFITAHLFAETSALTYERTLTEYADANVRFIAQFWQELKLKEVPKEVDLHQMSAENLREFIGISKTPLASTQLIHTWIRQFAPIFAYSRDCKSRHYY